MGELFVDPKLCSGCKVCVNVCPYKAIRFESEPIFDQGKCFGCWACFNRCPKKAIYTESVHGKGHYPWAADKFLQKFKV